MNAQNRFRATILGSLAVLAALGASCAFEFDFQRSVEARAETRRQALATERANALEKISALHVALLGQVLGIANRDSADGSLENLRAELGPLAGRPESLDYLAEVRAALPGSHDSLVAPRRLLAIEGRFNDVRGALEREAAIERNAARASHSEHIESSEWRTRVFGTTGLGLVLFLALYVGAGFRRLPFPDPDPGPDTILMTVRIEPGSGT